MTDIGIVLGMKEELASEMVSDGVVGVVGPLRGASGTSPTICPTLIQRSSLGGGISMHTLHEHSRIFVTSCPFSETTRLTSSGRKMSTALNSWDPLGSELMSVWPTLLVNREISSLLSQGHPSMRVYFLEYFSKSTKLFLDMLGGVSDSRWLLSLISRYELESLVWLCELRPAIKKSMFLASLNHPRDRYYVGREGAW